MHLRLVGMHAVVHGTQQMGGTPKLVIARRNHTWDFQCSSPHTRCPGDDKVGLGHWCWVLQCEKQHNSPSGVSVLAMLLTRAAVHLSAAAPTP